MKTSRKARKKSTLEPWRNNVTVAVTTRMIPPNGKGKGTNYQTPT
jgi:hypothetical protein